MEGEETRYFAVKQNGRRLLDKAFLCDDTFKKYRYKKYLECNRNSLYRIILMILCQGLQILMLEKAEHPDGSRYNIFN